MSKPSGLLAAAGPFQGVKTVIDAPYQDAAGYLSFASNGYIRDPEGLSSWVSRPGFTSTNAGAQMGSGQRTQGSHAHTDPVTGTIYRFFVVNGVLYRSDAGFGAFTVVTPAGITIDTASTTRASFLSVGSSLVVTDGVNRPWVMSNFGATPVTGAYIDIDGAGGAWTAFGPPTIYQDSVFFITATVPGGSPVTARVGMVWCEPNQPTVGYTQSGYADFWNMIETGSDPLTAILGTNNGLFVWRENSITVASGTPSINFSSTATRDARGDGIGTLSPWAVDLFQSNIFFVDVDRRPWLMPLSGEPQPIWQQSMLSVGVQAIASITAYVVGVVVPEINQYLVAYQVEPTAGPSTHSPLTASIFDANTGRYGGEWSVGPGAAFDVMVQQRDVNGLPCLVVCGGLTSIAPSGGYVWQLNSIQSGPWIDALSSGSVMNVSTKALGYSADSLMALDRVVVITRTSNAVTLNVLTTSNVSTSLSATPTAGAVGYQSTYSDEYRSVFYLDGSVTRSVVLRVFLGSSSPTAQWGVQRIELYGTRCKAGPEDA